MTEHVTAWLGAYHDGELRGRRAQQVEAHLAGCAACRAELESLRELSALLGESPAAADLTPSERFVAQVGLRLPRHPEQPAWQRALEIGWQLAPLGLLAAWAVVQAVFAVAGWVLIALQMGLGDDAIAWLLPASPQGPWLAEVFGLSHAGLNDVGQIGLHLLRDGGPLGWGVTLNLVSLLVIGLLYWSWLASWWVRHRRQQRYQEVR
jgi:predicted anti-sigma-YlaC factor YlaD